MENTEKIYCGSAKIVNTQFGDLTKISFHKDDINKIVKYMKDNSLDWANLVLKEKQNKQEGKPTHFLEVDTWKPTKQAESKPSVPQAMQIPAEDELPF